MPLVGQCSPCPCPRARRGLLLFPVWPGWAGKIYREAAMFHLKLPPFGRKTSPRPGDISWSGLDKREAEDALDWLEAVGDSNPRLDYRDGQGFTVESHPGP